MRLVTLIDSLHVVSRIEGGSVITRCCGRISETDAQTVEVCGACVAEETRELRAEIARLRIELGLAEISR